MARSSMPIPRLAELGLRAAPAKRLGPDKLGCAAAPDADYHAFRIARGVPEGGRDFAFGEAFPHEALFDQLNGVDFTKGCYVGQEVVSRMEHRGTARKRIVPVEGAAALPASGTSVETDGVPIGTLGSVCGASGLALIRLDRAEEALAHGKTAHCGRNQDRTAATVLRALCGAGRGGAGMTGKGASERCPWPGTDPLYVAYHDEEWGVPERDDRALYEKLVLDGFQAGLSWITILRKREAFRRAFDGFAPEKIARYSQEESRGPDAGPKHRAQPHEDRRRRRLGARLARDHGERRGLRALSVGLRRRQAHVNRHRRMAEIPAETELSRAISKDLKARGFKFCGPTIIYAFMQATGMVNDHLIGLPASCGVREAWTSDFLAAAARIHAARIGALFLDLAVALSDANRAHAFDGSLQDTSLGRRRLGGKPLDDLPRAFVLQLPLLRLVVMHEGISRQFGHVRLPISG